MFIITGRVQSHLQLLQVRLLQSSHQSLKSKLVSGRYRNLKKVIVLVVPLCNLRRGLCDFAPRDRIVQKGPLTDIYGYSSR